MSLAVHVDVSNPGQFFACCGLFELAARLDVAAQARFEHRRFVVDAGVTLGDVLTELTRNPLIQEDPTNNASSPIRLPPPFELLLDWWKDDDGGCRELKLWAGTMQSVRIAQAMIAALRDKALHTEELLDHGCVVYDPAEPTKKVEPFYFDARRAPNAHSRDVGFSPNDLDMTTTAFPAVEALTLIGLQRFRPSPTEQRRVFDYRTWSNNLPISIASAVVCGLVRFAGTHAYRFERWYRTGQKKHKAFRPAVSLEGGS